jgi:hypothetical protein
MVVGATKECGGASAGWFELVGVFCGKRVASAVCGLVGAALYIGDTEKEAREGEKHASCWSVCSASRGHQLSLEWSASCMHACGKREPCCP